MDFFKIDREKMKSRIKENQKGRNKKRANMKGHRRIFIYENDGHLYDKFIGVADLPSQYDIQTVIKMAMEVEDIEDHQTVALKKMEGLRDGLNFQA